MESEELRSSFRLGRHDFSLPLAVVVEGKHDEGGDGDGRNHGQDDEAVNQRKVWAGLLLVFGFIHT